MSPAGEVDLETPPRYGKHSWLVSDGAGLKLYPMCYGTHRALDGVIALAREHDVATRQYRCRRDRGDRAAACQPRAAQSASGSGRQVQHGIRRGDGVRRPPRDVRGGGGFVRAARGRACADEEGAHTIIPKLADGVVVTLKEGGAWSDASTAGGTCQTAGRVRCAVDQIRRLRARCYARGRGA